jgi:hypothetical protein
MSSVGATVPRGTTRTPGQIAEALHGTAGPPPCHLDHRRRFEAD